MKPILKIQPIEYKGSRLAEVGERVVGVFHLTFNDYVINKRLRASDLGDILQSERKDGLFAPGRWVEKGKFLTYLEAYGKFTVGITSLGVVNDDNRLFGSGRRESRVACVSTADKAFGRVNSGIYLERVAIEALHELGHVFGLSHHDNEIRKTANGKYCPMTTVHSERVLAGEITWAQYISARDPNAFCDSCYWRLGMP